MWYPLTCPICKGLLSQIGRSLKCPQQHSFDLAREGYVNLHLARGRRTSDLGDTREMLQARGRFLETGAYAPLADTINRQVAAYIAEESVDEKGSEPLYVADLGCGSGYYLDQLGRVLGAKHLPTPIRYFGMDMAKEAVRLAARKLKDCRFFVANVWDTIPFHSGSLHVLLNVFAPRNVGEFHRILAGAGMLLVVTPGDNHLAEIRAAFNLLGIQPDKQTQVVEQFAQAFALWDMETIEYTIRLSGTTLSDLIWMTPNAWHTSVEAWKDLEQVVTIETQVSFIVHHFRKQVRQIN